MRTSILCKSLLTMALTIAFTSAQAQTTTTCTQCNDSIRDAKACTARPGEQCDTCTHKAGARVRRAVRMRQAASRMQRRHMMAQAQCGKAKCKAGLAGKAKCKACKAKKHTCKATNRYTPFSRMQRLEMAKAYIKGHGAINAKAYAKMTGLKRAMAEGELATFCNMSNAGIKAKAEGKKTVYVLK